MAEALRHPRPTVQLLHRLPDGSEHVDWMLARDDRGAARLITFRLPSPLGAGSGMSAERLADHRPVYLSYEGPIADAPGRRPQRGPDRGRERPAERGCVRRLRRGRIVEFTELDDAIEVAIVWEPCGTEAGQKAQRLRIERREGRRWRILPV